MQRARRHRRTRTHRPRILRYRWWLIARSRRGIPAAVVFVVAVIVVAFAARSRMAAQQELPVEPLGTPPT